MTAAAVVAALLLSQADRVPTPTFSPPAGTYSSAQTVTVSQVATGARTYCTTDGSDPQRVLAQVYSTPLSVPASATVKCQSWVRDRPRSRVGAAAYVIEAPPSGDQYALPATRATDWTRAGLTYGGAGIPTSRTQCGATLTPSGGNDLSQINAAITACGANQYVLLGPGTFTIHGAGQSVLINKSNVTLRGSGAGITTLTRDDGATDGSYFPNAAAAIIRVGGGQGTSASYNMAGAGAADGASSVVMASAPGGGFTPGQIVLVDELSGAFYQTDPNGRGQILMSSDGKVTYQCHQPPYGPDDCGNSTYSRADRVTNEWKEVARWDAGTMTLTFTSPFHTEYRTANSAQVSVLSSAPVTGVGIEDMTISRGDNSNISFFTTTYSWVKDVEVTKWLNEGIRIWRGFRNEVRRAYVHTPVYFEPGGGSYNITMEWGASETLIEDTISRDADKVIIGRGAGAGSVVAYSYLDDGHIGSTPGWQETGLGASHFVGSHHVLFEGNWAFNADNDKTHGNSNTHTYFRNLLRGKRTGYSDGSGNGSVRCGGVTGTTYYMSFVGNVLGASGQMSGWVYESQSSPNGNSGIWKIGWDDWSPYPTDPMSMSTLIRDGNFDYLTNQVHWHGLGGSGQGNGLTPPAASTLPRSMYLGGRPPFFTASYTWPWIDATGSTKSYSLPAKARYDGGAPVPAPMAQTPAISPASGTYTSGRTVSITSGTGSAEIRYTTDGTRPTAASSLYSAPFSVPATAVVRAVATAAGYGESYVATAVYVIETGAAPLIGPQHTAVRDGGNLLLSWLPQSQAYGEMINRVWDSWLGMPTSGGLPYWYLYSFMGENLAPATNWPSAPGGQMGMAADAAIHSFPYTGRVEVMDSVKAGLQYMLDHGSTSTSGGAWRGVFYNEACPGALNYNGCSSYGGAGVGDGTGNLEPDKQAELGLAYLWFYMYDPRLTHFRDAAIRVADQLVANRNTSPTRTAGPWPFRVRQTGGAANAGAGEQTCGNVKPAIELWDLLIAENMGSVASYQTARAAVWTWLSTYVVPNNDWANYFEDQPWSGTFQENQNQLNPGNFGRFLLQNPTLTPNYLTWAQGMASWIESNFSTTPVYGAVPIEEQFWYMYPMGSHTSRLAALNAWLYSATGNAAYKDKAFRGLNWATYMNRNDKYQLDGYPLPNQIWMTDGYGDTVRNFAAAMYAVPEWAPPGEDHLLGSTSVVQRVRYGKDWVSYRTYHAAAREVLRLSFTPSRVWAGSAALSSRADLSAEGYVWDAALGVLKVRHDLSGDVLVMR